MTIRLFDHSIISLSLSLSLSLRSQAGPPSRTCPAPTSAARPAASRATRTAEPSGPPATRGRARLATRTVRRRRLPWPSEDSELGCPLHRLPGLGPWPAAGPTVRVMRACGAAAQTRRGAFGNQAGAEQAARLHRLGSCGPAARPAPRAQGYARHGALHHAASAKPARPLTRIARSGPKAATRGRASSPVTDSGGTALDPLGSPERGSVSLAALMRCQPAA